MSIADILNQGAATNPMLAGMQAGRGFVTNFRDAQKEKERKLKEAAGAAITEEERQRFINNMPSTGVVSGALNGVR